MTELLILEEQSQFGQKQLSVQQHWCVSFGNWLIQPVGLFGQIIRALIRLTKVAFKNRGLTYIEFDKTGIWKLLRKHLNLLQRWR